MLWSRVAFSMATLIEDLVHPPRDANDLVRCDRNGAVNQNRFVEPFEQVLHSREVVDVGSKETTDTPSEVACGFSPLPITGLDLSKRPRQAGCSVSTNDLRFQVDIETATRAVDASDSLRRDLSVKGQRARDTLTSQMCDEFRRKVELIPAPPAGVELGMLISHQVGDTVERMRDCVLE